MRCLRLTCLLSLCIVQEAGEAEAEPRVFYGVCMVDPTTGAFHMGQFEDGPQRWRLRTLLSQFSPSEVRVMLEGRTDKRDPSPSIYLPAHRHIHTYQVLLERGVASGALEQMVRFCAPGALVEFLRPGEEFWGPRRTFRYVRASWCVGRHASEGERGHGGRKSD